MFHSEIQQRWNMLDFPFLLLYFQFRSSFIQSDVKSTCIRESFLSEQILFLSNESQNIVG